MTISVQTLPINTLHSLTLDQVIPANQALSTTENLFQFTESHVLVSEQVALNGVEPSTSSTVPALSATEAIELVVFGTITFAQLIELCQKSKVTITQLTAINQRNGQVSYRFAVNCADLEKSKAFVAEYGLHNNLESVLIKNAPKLSTPGLLVMDMDSTTIEIECIDEIAALAGVGEQVAEVTELAMQGKLDFAQSLKQRVATLTNAPETVLAEVAKHIPLMPGLTALIKELKQHDWRVAIASGGFTYFADHLKEELGLDAAHANVLEIKNGKLTGQVLGDIVDAQGKAEYLLALSKEYNIAHQQTVAMGDGANDLVMMDAAHLGVAFRAKPIVLKKADTSINSAGLDCLLHWLA